MKIHEAIERMWVIFYSIPGKKSMTTEGFLREKERCHELMSEISQEVNEPNGETVVSVPKEKAI